MRAQDVVSFGIADPSSGVPVLVTGGAGFVGSHACKALRQSGFMPVTYDNLSRGAAEAVQWGPLEIGDLEDERRLAGVIGRYRPVAVLHFAAFTETGGSIRNPESFYRNNVSGTLSLLKVMQSTGVGKLIFSSTAAVYGEPNAIPIDEQHPVRPLNPYGRSKLMVEDVIVDISNATGLKYASLRYFNAAGADPEGYLSENHDPESHLLPLILESISDERDSFTAFGNDYDTLDGTCVRDFVHVSDLADAHVAALQHLIDDGHNLIINLGSGRGCSVLEMVAAVERVTGRKVPLRIGSRRGGDPAVLIADNGLARDTLGWAPRHDLDAMVRHAWASMPLRRALRQRTSAIRIPA